MTLWGHVRYVCGVAWSGAGHIASGGFDQAVRLWDCVTGAELKKLVGHTDWVRSLAFTPGGQRCVCVCVWFDRGLGMLPHFSHLLP